MLGNSMSSFIAVLNVLMLLALAVSIKVHILVNDTVMTIMVSKRLMIDML